MPLKPPSDPSTQLGTGSLEARADALEEKFQVHLNDYLPVGFVSDSTVVTTAIQDWFIAAQVVGAARGSVKMKASPGVYRYLAPLTPAILGTLTGVAVEMDTEGATFADQRIYAAPPTPESARFVRLVTCTQVKINLHLTSEDQFDTPGLDLPNGLIGIELRQGSTVDHINLRMEGGREGVSCVKAFSDPESYKTRGGRIDINATGVFYPYAGQFSGCDNDVHIEADTPGRAFTIYGVQNSKIYSRSKNQGLTSVISSYNAQGCSNIDVHWVDRESTVGTFGITLQWRQGPGPVPMTQRDIRIHFDLLAGTGAGAVDCRALHLQKDVSDTDSTDDSTGRGHVLDGLKLDGSIEFTGSGITRNIIVHESAAGGELVATGTPDIMRRIDVSDLRISSSSTNDRSLIRATCLEDIMHVRNVNSTQDFTIGNLTSGRVLITGSRAKRFSQDATNTHTYIDCVVTGASQTASPNMHYLGKNAGTALGTPLSVTAAATLAVPDSNLVAVTGNTNITAITPKVISSPVTLKFSGTPTVSSIATVKLAGGANFVATADDTLTLMCDGTTWWEVGRSVNA